MMPTAQWDLGVIALLGVLAAEAVVQKCPATCLPLFVVVRPGVGFAGEEAAGEALVVE